MRLPNGFGNVSKLPGNRRNSYRARITIGWKKDETGKQHQQYRTIGYYKTRKEAMIALSLYHNNPLEYDTIKPTFDTVYKRWSSEHYPKISDSNRRGYCSAYQNCTNIYHIPFSELRLVHLQSIINQSNKNYPVLRRIKILFSQLFKYAIQNDICEKDYSQFIDIAQFANRNPNELQRFPFTWEEIETLWKNSENPYVKVILMLIYSGCRISELLQLKKENVNLTEHYFYIAHAKTVSGVRFVPIADVVFPFWKWWFHKSKSDYLIVTKDDKFMQYRNFYETYWKPMMKQLNMKHFPHDTRHTCVSLLSAIRTDEKIIRKIVGHKGKSVTEIVYTHYEMEELKKAINRIGTPS